MFKRSKNTNKLTQFFSLSACVHYEATFYTMKQTVLLWPSFVKPYPSCEKHSSLELRHNPDPTSCARARGRIQRKPWCMDGSHGTYAGVDYNHHTLCPLQSRLQHIYHGQPYARVDLNPMPESTLSPSQYFGFGLWSLLCIAIYTAKCYWSEDYSLSLTCRHFTAWDRNKEDRKRSSQFQLSNY